MRLNLRQQTRRRTSSGHSLPEAIVAVCLAGMMLISLYAGFSTGFTLVRSARENLRATEILTQRTEALRLYNWSQLNDAKNYLRTTFTERYNPAGETNGTCGAVYHGTVELDVPADLPAAYRDRLRLVTLTLTWTNQNAQKPIVSRRQMQTYVSRYGLNGLFTLQ
jgi:Tfp pilus assembly protein PilV